MANHKSALKKARQDRVRRARNRAGRSKLRTALKNYRAGLVHGAWYFDDQRFVPHRCHRADNRMVVALSHNFARHVGGGCRKGTR